MDLEGLGRSAELADHLRQVAVDHRELAAVQEVSRILVGQVLAERERLAVLGLRLGRLAKEARGQTLTAPSNSAPRSPRETA